MEEEKIKRLLTWLEEAQSALAKIKEELFQNPASVVLRIARNENGWYLWDDRHMYFRMGVGHTVHGGPTFFATRDEAVSAAMKVGWIVNGGSPTV